jgi:DMSO/TMAO reductase YedYZ molybdopterin-dependent catalytic subunit
MENMQKHYTREEAEKARQSFSSGLIVRQKEPNNLETPVDRVDSFLTPTELFYVRGHSPAPNLEVASYRLQIDDAVRSPLSITYQELRDMPAETVVAILECAGNSRLFLAPGLKCSRIAHGARPSGNDSITFSGRNKTLALLIAKCGIKGIIVLSGERLPSLSLVTRLTARRRRYST